MSEELVCSAKGCTAPAEFELGWNNPKVHTPERRKVWLACPEHRDSLSDYLRTRSFPVQVTPLDVELDRVPDPT